MVEKATEAKSKIYTLEVTGMVKAEPVAELVGEPIKAEPIGAGPVAPN